MKSTKRIAPTWAVDWMHNGRREVLIDYKPHRTKAGAQKAFAAHYGIPWADAAKAGAKLVKRNWVILPRGGSGPV